MHWISWEQILLPTDEGGLGIRRLSDMVIVFSYKLWWRYRALNSLWARNLHNKYGPTDFLEHIRITGHDNRIWRRLVQIGTEAHQLIRWSLAKGDVSFWGESWFVETSLCAFCSASSFQHVSVSSLFT